MRIDEKARRLFLVERTQRGEVRPGAFEGNVSADDIHDVAGGANLLKRGGREKARHGISSDATPPDTEASRQREILARELRGLRGCRFDQQPTELILDPRSGE